MGMDGNGEEEEEVRLHGRYVNDEAEDRAGLVARGGELELAVEDDESSVESESAKKWIRKNTE